MGKDLSIFEALAKEDHHRSRKLKGKQKDRRRRNDGSGASGGVTLSEIEKDYASNINLEEGAFECLDSDQLLASLDQMDFSVAKEDSADFEENDPEVDEEKLERILEKGYTFTSFNQLNRYIKLFLKDEEESTLEIAPFPVEIRKFIHQLSNLYRLKSKSLGRGDEKCVIIEKVDGFCLSANTRELDRILEKGNKAVQWAMSGGCRGKSSKKKTLKPQGSAKPAPGSVVGKNCPPIAEDNVGNQMLQKMGWQPGSGLGRDSSGIVLPITAVVKTKRTGLS